MDHKVKQEMARKGKPLVMINFLYLLCKINHAFQAYGEANYVNYAERKKKKVKNTISFFFAADEINGEKVYRARWEDFLKFKTKETHLNKNKLTWVTSKDCKFGRSCYNPRNDF